MPLGAVNFMLNSNGKRLKGVGWSKGGLRCGFLEFSLLLFVLSFFGVFCLQRWATCYNKLFIAYSGGPSHIHTLHYTIRSPLLIPKSISKASFESFKELCPFTLHWLPKSMQHISEAIINVIIGPWSCTETRRKITKMMPRPRNRDYAIHTHTLHWQWSWDGQAISPDSVHLLALRRPLSLSAAFSHTACCHFAGCRKLKMKCSQRPNFWHSHNRTMHWEKIAWTS